MTPTAAISANSASMRNVPTVAATIVPVDAVAVGDDVCEFENQLHNRIRAMKTVPPIQLRVFLLAFGLSLAVGCSTVSSRNHPYLGVPGYPPTETQHVQVVAAEPAPPHYHLGEIFVNVSGEPSKERIENALRKQAAKLGADAAVIVYDRTHLFPVVYVDWWGATVSHDRQRDIVAVAIRYKNEQTGGPLSR